MEDVQSALQSAVPAEAVRWTPPSQIHLTLRFLGHIAADSVADLDAALQRACQGVAPFQLSASAVGAFPEAGRPRVLWVGLHGELDRLRLLHAQLRLETEPWGEPEEREFHPHLTLGRVKHTRPAALRAVAQALTELKADAPRSWRVDQVLLMQSQLSPRGATHTCLVRVPLA